MMLGLRTRYGVDLKKIKETYGIDLREEKKSEIDEFKKNSLIVIEKDNLIVTSVGMPVLNKIILELVANIEIKQ